MAENARELPENATPRPWYQSGPPWDANTTIIWSAEDPHGALFIANTTPDENHDVENWERAEADAALIVAAVNEYEALLDVEDAARQLVRRDIPMAVVALCEANLLVALANLDAVRSGAALPAVDAASQVDRIPSHRSDELPRYIQINRANFRVDAETLTGEQIRWLPNPPIGKDYDLWKLEPFGEDSLVADSDVIDLRGARFFSSPSIINAGGGA